MSGVRCCVCYVHSSISTIGRVHVAPCAAVTLHGALHRRQIEVTVSCWVKHYRQWKSAPKLQWKAMPYDHGHVWCIWKQRKEHSGLQRREPYHLTAWSSEEGNHEDDWMRLNCWHRRVQLDQGCHYRWCIDQGCHYRWCIRLFAIRCAGVRTHRLITYVFCQCI